MVAANIRSLLSGVIAAAAVSQPTFATPFMFSAGVTEPSAMSFSVPGIIALGLLRCRRLVGSTFCF
jgi:hypothetical protein